MTALAQSDIVADHFTDMEIKLQLPTDVQALPQGQTFPVRFVPGIVTRKGFLPFTGP
jgi:hypothetical protein